MEIKIGKREYLWGYLGYFYRYGIRFLTIPLVWHYLDKTDLDVWFIFLSITTFVGLLDFGFSPNISRAVSYAFSGVRELTKTHAAAASVAGGVNYVLLAAIISAAKKIYAAIAGAALLLLATGGTWYLLHVLGKYEGRLCLTHLTSWEENGKTTYYLLVWVFFVLSQVIDIYFKYIGVLVNGRGLVGITQKFAIVSSIIGIGVTMLVLHLGFGILGTVSVGLVFSIAYRLFYGWLFFTKVDKSFLPKLREARKSSEKPAVFRNLWHNSWKMGINSVGLFALFQATVLLSGVLFKESYITQVGITLQVFNMLNIVSSAWFNMSFPRYASLYVLRKIEVLRREFLQALLLGLLLYGVGFTAVYFFGGDILRVLGKDKILLPGGGVLLLYGLVFLSEAVHGKCATFLTAKNIVPFVPATLATGVANLVLIALLTHFTDLGIMAFALATLCVNLVYNSWHWPLEVIRQYRFTLHDLKNVFRHARAFAHYRIMERVRARCG
ncbi:MAG: hypothetical protein LBR07_03140 [Puniceicoccales bacterium]|jgi:O-antigen/teichoic acid export membrane protein|nr:hypothetical protein [Puniceicoccales bacterium]